MNKQNDFSNHEELASQQDDALFHDLFRLIEDQPAIPEERFQRVRANVEADWSKMVAERKRSRFSFKLFDFFSFPYQAVAASMVLTVCGLLLFNWLQVQPIATVDVVASEVRLIDSAADNTVQWLSQAGTELFAGQTLETGKEHGLGLRLADGQSLRLDTNSRLRLNKVGAFVLERGAVYFDSNHADADPISIETAFGTARDIGTQFEVRVLDESLRLRVREGQVQLRRKEFLAEKLHAERGDVLTLNTNGAVNRDTVKPFDESWRWAEQLAPTFELEGQSLDRFLRWISRENGWQLSYRRDALKAYARNNILHGSIADMSSDDALEAVSLSGGIEYELDGGVLRITKRI